MASVTFFLQTVHSDHDVSRLGNIKIFQIINYWHTLTSFFFRVRKWDLYIFFAPHIFIPFARCAEFLTPNPGNEFFLWVKIDWSKL